MRYDMIYKHADLYLKIGRALKALLERWCVKSIKDLKIKISIFLLLLSRL